MVFSDGVYALWVTVDDGHISNHIDHVFAKQHYGFDSAGRTRIDRCRNGDGRADGNDPSTVSDILLGSPRALSPTRFESGHKTLVQFRHRMGDLDDRDGPDGSLDEQHDDGVIDHVCSSALL